MKNSVGIEFFSFPASEIHQLPESPGVYHFIGDNNEILYIGKSIHLRRRVHEHLRESRETFRAKRLRDLVRRVAICETGSELVALLLESQQIKEFAPIFNRAQRRSSFPWGLFTKTNESGYTEISLRRISGQDDPVAIFVSASEGRKYLDKVIEKYHFCPKLCGLEKWTQSCFSYQVKRCFGACLGEEDPSLYNLRIQRWLRAMRFRKKNFWLVDKSKKRSEWAIAAVQNGLYLGFGFFKGALKDIDPQIPLPWFLACPDNRDIRRILKSYQDRAAAILAWK